MRFVALNSCGNTLSSNRKQCSNTFYLEVTFLPCPHELLNLSGLPKTSSEQVSEYLDDYAESIVHRNEYRSAREKKNAKTSIDPIVRSSIPLLSPYAQGLFKYQADQLLAYDDRVISELKNVTIYHVYRLDVDNSSLAISLVDEDGNLDDPAIFEADNCCDADCAPRIVTRTSDGEYSWALYQYMQKSPIQLILAARHDGLNQDNRQEDAHEYSHAHVNIKHIVVGYHVVMN